MSDTIKVPHGVYRADADIEGWVEVPCRSVGVPGLIAARALEWGGFGPGMVPSTRSWQLAHKPTARAIGDPLPSIAAVQRVARDVAHLLDWPNVTLANASQLLTPEVAAEIAAAFVRERARHE